MSKQWGSARSNWTHFDLILGVGEDLLPVVSNIDAEVSTQSKMKSLGKTPSKYNPSGKVVGIPNWTAKKSKPKEIEQWSVEPDYGICLQTRTVRALDVDVPDHDKAKAITDFIVAELGRTLPTRFRNNSGKVLQAFSLSGDMPKRKLIVDGGMIEFLATGQQFIAVGTHPSGVRYEWDGGLPTEFPSIPLEVFEDLWATLAARFAIEDSGVGTVSMRQRGEHIDLPDPVRDYLTEKKMVLATDRDGALLIECPWHSEHTTGEVGDGSTCWFPAGTNGYDRGNFKCLHGHCEGRGNAEFFEAVGYEEDVIDDFEPLPELKDGSKARFVVEPAGDFAEGKCPGWIVKGVIPGAPLVVLYGEPGGGKSFLSLDITMAVARGVPWRGLRTKEGRVVYIAAEGGGGLRSRLSAYSRYHDVDLHGLQFGIIHASPNFLQKDDVNAVIQAINLGGHTDIVVVDTFAQVMPGGNENSGEDVGKALAYCQMIHRATGATVILVHHSGKDKSKGPRGWSGLFGASDAIIEVQRTPVGRLARISKQKDGVDGLEWAFDLESVTVGVDEDGDFIDSCVVVEADLPVTGNTRKLGKWESLVMEAVNSIAPNHLDITPVDALLDRVIELAPEVEDGRRDTRRQSAQRALNNLCKGDCPALTSEGDTVSVLC